MYSSVRIISLCLVYMGNQQGKTGLKYEKDCLVLEPTGRSPGV